MGKEIFVGQYYYDIVLTNGITLYCYDNLASPSEKDALKLIVNNTYNQPIIVSLLTYLNTINDEKIHEKTRYICDKMKNLDIDKYSIYVDYNEFIYNNLQTILQILLYFWQVNIIVIKEVNEIK